MDILEKFNELITTLAENPYISITGFAIGIISLFYAFYIARRDRKVKWLRYYTGSSNLIENGGSMYPLLDVTYDGRKLDNFTITKLTIKNKGTEVLRQEDIAKNDPIQISISKEHNAELLEYKIISASNKNNNFLLTKKDDHSFSVEFDFVEPEDSVTIQLLHTGLNSQDVIVVGTVIGARRPFASKDVTDLPKINLVFTRYFRVLFRVLFKVPSRIIALVVSILGTLLFVSSTRYYFLNSNITLALLCSIPSAFFIFLLVLAIFRRTDPELEALSNERFKNILLRSMPEDEREIDIN